LGVEHLEAARQDFDQVLRGLFLVLRELVLRVDDVELFFEEQLLHLHLQGGPRFFVNDVQLLIFDIVGLDGPILEHAHEVLALDD